MQDFENGKKIENLVYDSSKHLTTLCTGSILVIIALLGTSLNSNELYLYVLFCFMFSLFGSTLVMIFYNISKKYNIYEKLIEIVWIISYLLFLMGVILIVYLFNPGLIQTIFLFLILFSSIQMSWFIYKEMDFKRKFIIYKSVRNIAISDFFLYQQHPFYLRRRDPNNQKIIEDTIIHRLRNKKDVTILGKPGSGKTRCVFEVIKNLPSETVLIMPPKFPIENLKPPNEPWFSKKKHYLLFLDDASSFADYVWIADFVEKIQKKNHVSIIITLRTGDEYENAKNGALFKHDRFNSLLIDSETKILLPDLTYKEGKTFQEN